MIDGNLYAMAPPYRIHQELVGELYSTIHNYILLKNSFCKFYPAPFAVKLFKYRTAGVREYWIVNPLKKVVQTYSFEGEEYSNAFLFDEEIPVHIFDGLTIKVSELLQ